MLGREGGGCIRRMAKSLRCFVFRNGPLESLGFKACLDSIFKKDFQALAIEYSFFLSTKSTSKLEQ